MLFNSPEFIFCFLPLLLAGYAVFAKFGRGPVIGWLAIGSLAFYAYWKPAFLLVLVGSILTNYLLSRLIWRWRARRSLQKWTVVLGVTLNLGALCYFKYLFPFLHFLSSQFGLLDDVGNVVLPLGISFFTFTQIAYLIDLSQDEAEPQGLPSYVLFVTFFPHLIAGPILHHGEIMPQFAHSDGFRLRWDDLSVGTSWFILGLAKKVLIADHLSPLADAAFAHPGELGALAAWLGVLNYSLQLYFDFSGYSDMAIGLARMFSIKFPFNFDSPYRARNIIDFWSRWHMTLTRYLTLYLYNPVSLWINRRRAAAGKPNSRKALRTLSGFSSLVAAPTFFTMLLAGIWHGAGFQFIIFGALHGLYLTINHAWRVVRTPESVLSRVLAWPPAAMLLTYLAVLVGQIFFRAGSTHEAVQMLGSMVGGGSAGSGAPFAVQRAALVLLLYPVVWLLPNTQEILGQSPAPRPNILGASTLWHWRPNAAWAASLGVLSVGVLWYLTNVSSFLYFQF
jgi:alginate O-acetyltransferase complex protein AlgI